MASSRQSQAASLLFYFSVGLVAATSVAFGLDWMRAPLPPMPETEASVQAAKLAAHVPPPRPLTVIAKTAPRSVYPKRPAESGSAVAAVDATANNPQDAAAPAIAAPEPAAAQTPAEQPKCDVAACSAAYHSFRASDCTWQPFDGPRRFCDRGNPPQSEAAVEPGAAADATPVSNLCDVEACRRAYFTFNPADCTYQPSNGSRRLCEKGHPPQKTAVTEPAAATPPAAAAAAPADATQVSNKCDVEACKQAYFTFNPADCTYQPSDGARRLCTKGTPPKPEAALPSAPPPPVAAAPPPSAAPPTAASPNAPPAPALPAVPNAEPPKQEAAVPPAAAPPSPAATAPADIAAPPAPAPPAAAAAPAVAAPAAVSDKCDVEACKQAYFTFNPADCTYQPSDGARRLCTKGTPPKPEAALPPAPPPPVAAAPPPSAAPPTAASPNAPPAPALPAVPNAEPAKQEAAVPPAAAPPSPAPTAPADIAAPPAPAPPAAAAPAAVSDKCDVEACKRAYFTFNPADCTYKPSSGPRRLCTKGAPPKPQAAAPAAAAPDHPVPPGLVPARR